MQVVTEQSEPAAGVRLPTRKCSPAWRASLRGALGLPTQMLVALALVLVGVLVHQMGALLVPRQRRPPPLASADGHHLRSERRKGLWAAVETRLGKGNVVAAVVAAVDEAVVVVVVVVEAVVGVATQTQHRVTHWLHHFHAVLVKAPCHPLRVRPARSSP